MIFETPTTFSIIRRILGRKRLLSPSLCIFLLIILIQKRFFPSSVTSCISAAGMNMTIPDLEKSLV